MIAEKRTKSWIQHNIVNHFQPTYTRASLYNKAGKILLDDTPLACITIVCLL